MSLLHALNGVGLAGLFDVLASHRVVSLLSLSTCSVGEIEGWLKEASAAAPPLRVAERAGLLSLGCSDGPRRG